MNSGQFNIPTVQWSTRSNRKQMRGSSQYHHGLQSSSHRHSQRTSWNLQYSAIAWLSSSTITSESSHLLWQQYVEIESQHQYWIFRLLFARRLGPLYLERSFRYCSWESSWCFSGFPQRISISQHGLVLWLALWFDLSPFLSWLLGCYCFFM